MFGKNKLAKVQVHEAGHIITARQLGLEVSDATASLSRDEGEVNYFLPEGREFLLAPMSAGGAAAEICWFGRIVNETHQLADDMEKGGWRSWRAFEQCATALAQSMTRAQIASAAKEVRLV